MNNDGMLIAAIHLVFVLGVPIYMIGIYHDPQPNIRLTRALGLVMLSIFLMVYVLKG